MRRCYKTTIFLPLQRLNRTPRATTRHLREPAQLFLPLILPARAMSHRHVIDGTSYDEAASPRAISSFFRFALLRCALITLALFTADEAREKF